MGGGGGMQNTGLGIHVDLDKSIHCWLYLELHVGTESGLTEFRIEVGVHRAPNNVPWEPSTKG